MPPRGTTQWFNYVEHMLFQNHEDIIQLLMRQPPEIPYGIPMGGPVPSALPTFPAPTDRAIVYVQNDSGHDLLVGDVLEIGGSYFNPVDNPNQFLNQPILSGVTPGVRSRGRICILTQDLQAGRTGPACISGFCVARLFGSVAVAPDVNGWTEMPFKYKASAIYGYHQLTATQEGPVEVIWDFGPATLVGPASASGTTRYVYVRLCNAPGSQRWQALRDMEIWPTTIDGVDCLQHVLAVELPEAQPLPLSIADIVQVNNGTFPGLQYSESIATSVFGWVSEIRSPSLYRVLRINCDMFAGFVHQGLVFYGTDSVAKSGRGLISAEAVLTADLATGGTSMGTITTPETNNGGYAVSNIRIIDSLELVGVTPIPAGYKAEVSYVSPDPQSNPFPGTDPLFRYVNSKCPPSPV